MGNCLTRLAAAGQVPQVSEKPRRIPQRDIGIKQARPSTSVAKGAVMKVIGLGSPDDVRVRFDASEVDVLVDVLRDLRAKATREAAETYATTPPGETRPIDDRHDRLRWLEGLLMHLEEQPPDDRPEAILVGDTTLIRDIARRCPGSSRTAPRRARALRGSRDARSREALLGAAKTAKGVGHHAHRRRACRPGPGRVMRPSPSAPARATVIGVRQPPARKFPNLTAARALRAARGARPRGSRRSPSIWRPVRSSGRARRRSRSQHALRACAYRCVAGIERGGLAPPT